jgi:hypothetical protein
MREATEARIQVVRAALRELDRVEEDDGHSERALARLRDVYETRLEWLEPRLVSGPHQDDMPHGPREQELRGRVIGAQRDALRQLAGKRAAPVEVIREIEHGLDLESARLPHL